MFLFDATEIIVGILSIPIIVIVGVTLLVAAIYIAVLTLQILHNKSKLGIREIMDLRIQETTNIPNYEPAIMGYLVNCQKIGKREICSTLFDLISRGVISVDITKGLVTDNKGEYIFKIKNEELNLKEYEKYLIKYLYGRKKKITIDELGQKLYKKNLDKDAYAEFLRLVQKEAKTKNFFDRKAGKRKMRIYKIVDAFVTGVATVVSGLGALGSCALEGCDASVDMGDIGGVIVITFIVYLAGAAILWGTKFLVSFVFNLNCYYNEFSEEGKRDYIKWIGFKKYLQTYSTIPNHPIMGVKVWERYYAYSIGLKCSKKFFKQMKTMKIVDNSIDIKMFENFNDIVGCIGTSIHGIKKVAEDEFGGAHIEY